MTDAIDTEIRWGDYDRSNPYPAYAKLRERGPVAQVTLTSGEIAWVVTRYAEAKAALNDPRLSKDMHAALEAGPDIVDEGYPGPAFARHMLSVDPPDHGRLRHLVADRFTHRALTDLEPRIQQIIDDLLDRLAAPNDDAVVDLMEAFAFPMPFTVICEMLGVPAERQRALGSVLDLLLRPIDSADAHERARRASEELASIFTQLITAKALEPGDDLISDLVRAGREGLLDHVELQSTVFNLIVAGHETTTNLIGNAVLALLRDPSLRSSLTTDPDLIPGALEELMRHDGPVHHATFRFALEPVTLGGVTIPAGAQVLVCLAAANRDETQYADGDRFDATRSGPRHLAFGHGIHHCLGVGLARLEGRLAITALLDRFPQLTLAVDPDELTWDRGDGVVVRGMVALPVRLGSAAAG